MDTITIFLASVALVFLQIWLYIHLENNAKEKMVREMIDGKIIEHGDKIYAVREIPVQKPFFANKKS